MKISIDWKHRLRDYSIVVKIMGTEVWVLGTIQRKERI